MGSSLKIVQTVRLVMLVSIVVYALLGERLGPDAGPNNPIIFYAITVVAIAMIAAIFVLRRLMVLRSEAVLRTKPEDATALSRWRVGYIATYAICEAVALYGIVLRFMGFTFWQVAPFYLVGFVLILFFAPRRPSNQVG